MRAHHEVDDLLKKFAAALQSPRTMVWLENRFDVHRSTIWKWSNWLEERGMGTVVPTTRGRPTLYQLE